MAKEINRLLVAVHDLFYCPLVCLTSILILLSTVCQPRVAANAWLLGRPPVSPLGEGYIGGSVGKAATRQVPAGPDYVVRSRTSLVSTQLRCSWEHTCPFLVPQ